MAPRGGSGSGSQSTTVAALQGQSPMPARTTAPAAVAAGASSAALLAAVAGASGAGTSPITSGAVNPGAKATAPTLAGSTKPDSTSETPADSSATSVSSVTSPSSIPNLETGNASGPSQEVFPYFPLYVLDNNDGVVLFPGVNQLATLRGSVELNAQVSGVTVSSYFWNTSGISSDATSISGASTNQLSFQWTYENSTAHVNAITLSVKDSSNQIEDLYLRLRGPGRKRAVLRRRWQRHVALDPRAQHDRPQRSRVGQHRGRRGFQLRRPRYHDLVTELQPQCPRPRPDLRFGRRRTPLRSSSRKTPSAPRWPCPSKVAATLTFNGTVGTT